MKLSWPTLVTLLVSSIIVPLFSQWKLDLTTAQTTWLTAALIALPTAIAHLWHGRVLQQAALKASTSKVAAFIPLLVLVPFFGGCAAFSNFIHNGGTQAVIGDVIGVTVGLVLANNPEDAPAVKTAASAIAGLTATSANLSNFEAEADAIIAKQNAPAQVKAELTQIVALVATGLAIGANALPADATFTVNLIFTDIANTASSFTTVSNKARSMGVLHR